MHDIDYVADLDNPDVKLFIESNYTESICYENVFDQNTLDQIWQYCWQNPKPRFNGDKGIVYIHTDLSPLKDIANLNFLSGYKESPVIGGNYFISSYPYTVHTDSLPKSDWKPKGQECVPWKNVLIPLWHNNNPGTFITYKNRYADWAKSDSELSSYSLDNFDSLEKENEWEWVPGNAYVFDAVQAHSSTKPKDRPFTLKGGVFLKFLKRYNIVTKTG